jgi:hypothetical protein
MIPLPDRYHLTSFFETDPILSFPNETWEYNHLTFVVTRGDERLVCEMEPSELVLSIKWSSGDMELLSVNLGSADGLKIDDPGGKREQMHVTFSDGIGKLVLQLRPTIHIFIETKLA